MVIDVILDRCENELFEEYNAHAFYVDIIGYGRVAAPILEAMDGGTEDDVKNAICKYIDDNEYNPRIKKFVRRVNWLTDETIPA